MAATAASRALEQSVDYSFALEYKGPPLPFDLPQALPIDLDRIPLASLALSPASLAPVSLPLPHPKPSVAVSPTSVVDGPGELPPGPSGDLSVDFSGSFKESASASADADAESSNSGFPSDDEPPPPAPRRPSAVTFGDHPAPVGPPPPAPRQRPRRGACHRCLRGGRFTEKEACLVCDAKYCAGCVLRAMGSMPEGRKCVACIGFPVEESRRAGMGKCSRMLRRLLSPLEIEQAMKAERWCEANQLRAECVCINGKPLSPEEMVMLRSCANPPSKLKPGSYWYDKVSGLWGKEGCKPHLIISPNLPVGGLLSKTASNGNTGVYINCRNITVPELKMLKYAGVQCAGNPNFWVHADGTYQEEGMNNVKGNLWDKRGMRLACLILSLPYPSKMVNPLGDVDGAVNRNPGYIEERLLQKFLLVGCHGSGTSTILKQAKFLYNPVPFSEEEREEIKLTVQTSIYHYLCILLEGRDRFEEECLANKREASFEDGGNLENKGDACKEKTIYSLSPRLKSFSNWLLKVSESGNLEAIFPAASREYAPLVEELWKDPAIQATYARRKELRNLSTSANYFLERVVDISRMEYEPSDRDILFINGVSSSNGLAHTEFLFPQTAHESSDIDDVGHHETIFRYQLIRVQSRGPSENKKWLDMFEDARLVIFCVAASDYCEYDDEPNGETINKMLSSKMLFENIVTHPAFGEMEFLLVLTKLDLLEKKIQEVPLTACTWFDDFNPPMMSHHQAGKTNGNNSRTSANKGANKGATPAEQAFHYIAVKYKKLYASITGRRLYVSMANGLDSESVDRALRYAREVLKWEDERAVFGTCNELSAYSTDPSSISD